MKRPGASQLRYVAAIDLIERGISHTARVASPVAPLRRRLGIGAVRQCAENEAGSGRDFEELHRLFPIYAGSGITPDVASRSTLRGRILPTRPRRTSPGWRRRHP